MFCLPCGVIGFADVTARYPDHERVKEGADQENARGPSPAEIQTVHSQDGMPADDRKSTAQPGEHNGGSKPQRLNADQLLPEKLR